MYKILILLILFSCGKKNSSEDSIKLTEISSDKNLSSNSDNFFVIKGCVDDSLVDYCIDVYGEKGTDGKCPSVSEVTTEVDRCKNKSPFGLCRKEDGKGELVYRIGKDSSILGWSGNIESSNISETFKTHCELIEGQFLPYSISK